MTARNIRLIRLGMGLTQEELARRLGVARATVTRWENGSRRPPGIAGVALRETMGSEERHAWNALAGAALKALWDNPEDAIYDDWKTHYQRKAR